MSVIEYMMRVAHSTSGVILLIKKKKIMDRERERERERGLRPPQNNNKTKLEIQNKTPESWRSRLRRMLMKPTDWH